MEAAAEVGAAEVEGARGGCRAQKERCEVAGAEGVGEECEVEWSVDGVARGGMVELEAEVVGGRDGGGRVAEREARGGGGVRRSVARWRGVGHGWV